MTGSSRRDRAIWVGGGFAAALLLDVATKWLILNVVMVSPRTIEVAPFFNLTLGFNTGISFGMFQDIFLERPLMLAGIKVAITVGLLVWAMRTRRTIEATALGLIAGGAAGNIVDRVHQGAVTDFLDFHVGSWHWPSFNMADAAISVGVALLLTGSFFSSQSALRTREPLNDGKR
ncbi:signal peptidase II [Microbacteriaceae bacterium K1510]|nr:signal peptidase II [Microbacteriaceae bacterium K1510]